MDILSYFQLFANKFTSVILFFFPNCVNYKTVVLLIAIMTTFSIIWCFITKKFRKAPFITALISCLVIIVLYGDTSKYYITSNDKYNSFYLVFVGQITPSILFATIVSQLHNIQYKIKTLVPFIGIIFTIISFFAAFFPTSTTSGGYALNDNNLNYQNTSYMAAYAAAFNAYYLLCFKTIDWPIFFNSIKSFYLFFIFLIFNLLTILIAGGRGGLVLFIIQISIIGAIFFKNRKNSLNNFRNVFFSLLIIGIISFFAIHFASTYESQTNGFDRILATIEHQDQNGRDVLREKALNASSKCPLIGNGVGSVFYEIGEYSHNCITDVLVETGYIGCFLFIILIIKTFLICRKLLLLDITNLIWLIIFIDGVVQSLFSGYYLAQIPIYWIMAFMFSYEWDINDTEICTSYYCQHDS